ncbi:hypothetical protein EV191_11464 [Tamaricihabitans halophyticus]|uniref:Tryptophan-associated transmembrane protein n=1 Tax=Tamaricihabitans halophyticus TaxID=1262583 RepID=A0A4R2QBJ7_9PSEU|nr:B-4DMT family transporter [Tamaricihabitans halophyticus]TCP46267.1 hypothetical protein EV191_11464 [Tamaricihabitans halophyticus]
MSAWIPRALTLAIVHAAVQVALAAVEAHMPTDLNLVRPIVVALLVGVAALWGALDGWSRLVDRGRTWFIAALVAGPVSGVLAVIGRATMVDQTGVSELGPALTGGAAFIALLIMVPAGLGLVVGGRMQPAPSKHNQSASEDELSAESPAEGAASEEDPSEEDPSEEYSAGGDPAAEPIEEGEPAPEEPAPDTVEPVADTAEPTPVPAGRTTTKRRPLPYRPTPYRRKRKD